MKRLEQALQELNSKGYKITTHKQLNGGINSATFKVESSNNLNYALKIYPQPGPSDKRNRCLTEIRFLNYLEQCKNKSTPKLEAFNMKEGWALLSWIEGIKIQQLRKSELYEITEFISSINDESTQHARSQLQPASEACQSLVGLITNITERIEWIQACNATTHVGQKALQWLNATIKPYFESTSKKLVNRQLICRHWQDIAVETIASPSDVGVHNILRTEHGIYFLDFEYAGLDDLSKLAADWILQPECRFNKEEELTFIKSLSEKVTTTKDDLWVLRLNDIRPLIHIKWCLIMLNKLKRGQLDEKHLDKITEYFARGCRRN